MAISINISEVVYQNPKTVMNNISRSLTSRVNKIQASKYKVNFFCARTQMLKRPKKGKDNLSS